MNKERTAYLFHRYFENTATPAELAELELIIKGKEQQAWLRQLIDESYFRVPLQEVNGSTADYAKERIFNYIITQPQRKQPWNLWIRVAAAAAIILSLYGGSYLFLRDHPKQQIVQNKMQDIGPGGNKAVLVLSNGKRISLADVHNGVIARQGGANIAKAANGQLVYEKTPGPAETDMNRIEVPKGGQYHLTLTDGTRVWMNSASSLGYPSSFTGSNRKVELNGEAYFEVAHNPSKPFLVISKGQEVRVLGTHFNINAYPDEPGVKTTLLQGSVSVSASKTFRVIRPGEQAVLQNNQISVRSADLESVMAWKNNEFLFSEDDFHTAMRKIARWYNVEIVYDPSAPIDFELGGFVSRSKNISVVLKYISYTGKVHFTIEGRRVMVRK